MATKLNDIEVAFRLKGEQALKALDGIVEKSERANKSLKNLTDTTQKIGLGLAAVGAAITGAFALAINAAAEEEEQLRQLEGTVNSTGDSFEAQRPKIEAFIEGLTRVTGFSDDKLRPALNRAIFATNDVDKGMRAAELGAKIAAAGFGNLETNAVIVARLFEGQVQAIARLLPEFRDLEERLEAGASEADLAAEALQRLQARADDLKPPSDLKLFTIQLGELNEAFGKIALETIGPFVVKMTQAAEALAKFSETGFGKVITNITLFGGLLAGLAGSALLLVKPLVECGILLGSFASKMGIATKAVSLFRIALAFLAGPVGIIALVATALAGLAIGFNKASAAADEARDKLFKTDRLTQFKAELKELQDTIVAYNRGLISAGEAEKKFNKFGVASREEAGKRSEALVRIIARLEEERAEADKAAIADNTLAKTKQENIEETIAKLQKEKEERIQLDLAQEEFLRRELERGKKLASQITPITLPPLEPGPLQPLQTQTDEPISPLGTLTEGDTDVFIEKTGTLADRVEDLAQKELAAAAGGAAMREELEAAAEQAAVFENQLLSFVAGALDGLAQLASNFAVDLVSSFNEAGKNAQRFFAALGKQLLGAITKALILQAIIASVGGPTSAIGKLLSPSGPFQDPLADQMARFEGQRFVDLFFQGVTREMGNAQDRMDASLTENRNLVETRGKPTSIIVTEASPETTVEFTDRKVEPRVRARARQRTGNVDTPFGSTA